MTTQKTNQLNSCCYDHLIEDNENHFHETTKMKTSSKLVAFISNFNFDRIKYYLVEITTSLAIAIVTFILNLFIK